MDCKTDDQEEEKKEDEFPSSRRAETSQAVHLVDRSSSPSDMLVFCAVM